MKITIEEGIRRFLAGETDIVLYVQQDFDGDLTIQDLYSAKENGGYCTVPDPEPEPEPGPVAKKKTIDRGKVRALHEAGWTNKAIADEMGCSESGVSMILSKLFKEDKENGKNKN